MFVKLTSNFCNKKLFKCNIFFGHQFCQCTLFFLFSFLPFYLMLFQFINGLSLIFSLLLPCSDIFSNKAIRAVGCTAQ